MRQSLQHRVPERAQGDLCRAIQNVGPEFGHRLSEYIFYVTTATVLGMLITVLTACAVSRRDVLRGNAIMFFITFTIMFSGVMIGAIKG